MKVASQLIFIACLGFTVGALAFLSSCAESAKASDNDPRYMDCNPVRNSMNAKMQRCENDEAVCYLYNEASFTCMMK